MAAMNNPFGDGPTFASIFLPDSTNRTSSAKATSATERGRGDTSAAELRRRALSAYARNVGYQSSAQSNGADQGTAGSFTFGSPTHAAAVLASLPPDRLEAVEREFLGALQSVKFEELRLASAKEAKLIVEEEAADGASAGAGGAREAAADGAKVGAGEASAAATLLKMTAEAKAGAGPGAVAAATASTAAVTAAATSSTTNAAANAATAAWSRPSPTLMPTQPSTKPSTQQTNDHPFYDRIFAAVRRSFLLPSDSFLVDESEMVVEAQVETPGQHTVERDSQGRFVLRSVPSPQTTSPTAAGGTFKATAVTANATAATARAVAARAAAEGAPASASVPVRSSIASRASWLLLGSVLRAPVVGGLRFIGTKMAASSFFGSQLMGGVVVAICAIAELDSEYFNPPDPNAPRPQVPLEPTPLPRVQLLRERYVPIPSSWRAATLSDKLSAGPHLYNADTRCRRVAADESVRLQIERAMHNTAHASCMGLDGTGNTRRAKVLSVERVENLPLWKQYWHKKHELIDMHHANNISVKPLSPPVVRIDRTGKGGGPVLDPDNLLEAGLNEVFLFHGTTHQVADIITHHGFDERMSNLSGLYGAGVYFANQSCKAAQYAKDSGVKTLIVARVTLGDAHYASVMMQQYRRPPERDTRYGWKPGVTYDCVVANSGAMLHGTQAHRELIVYDHRQAYPEYIVRFRE